MKKKIVEALKTADTYKGLSDAILNRVADKLIASGKVKEEADIENAIGGLDLMQVIDSYADARANEASETAVKNYEKKHNLHDGKPVEQNDSSVAPPAPSPKPTEDEVPAWAKALQAEVEALRGEKAASARSTKFDTALKDLPDKLRERAKKEFERTHFKDDSDFDTWLEDTKTFYEGAAEDFKPAPRLPSGPKSGGSDTTPAASAGAKAYAAKVAKEAETATPALMGLPTTNK